MRYEVWDDDSGKKLLAASPEDKAKAFALKHDPRGERLFLEDESGDQIAWNNSTQQWDHI